MALAPGTRLGPYEIQGPLGAGGMGEVYRARDTRLGRSVAVKVLPHNDSSSLEDRARFRREAKTISSLNHPHICVLHDIGQEGGTDFLVMELVEGETLAQRIARGPLPAADVLKFGAQIADALYRAHRAGVIHRDLKPGNVMLTKSGAKLMDFGLARSAVDAQRTGAADATATAHAGPPKSNEPITAKGTMVGTFQYMSPEQLEGKSADERSDIWALGCVLYEISTGKRAFEGSTSASLISAIMRDQPRVMSEMSPLTPPALEQLVRACLAKDPEERIQTAHDVRLQLQWIAEAGARAGVAAPVAARRRTRERTAWALAGILVVVSTALSLLLLGAHGNQASRYSFTPLTYKPTPIFKAAFAPDGKTIVFSAALEGNTPQVFVIRPEYPEPQPLGDPGTHLLAVSPQGELAVLTNARYGGWRVFTGTLARMPLGGGGPREILKNVSDADWSPDGSKLAIIRSMEGKSRIEFPIGNVLCESGGYLSDLRFSPRGDQIAFFEHPTGGGNDGSVEVVDLAGKKTGLSDGHWSEEGLTWSKDGKEILFSASNRGIQLTVYAVTLKGKRRVALGSPGGQTIHDVSRDGRWLLTRDNWRSTLMVHRPEWPDDRDLSWLDYSTSGMLSRDASMLVFTEGGEAVDKSSVCIRKTDGSHVVRLGDGANYQLSPDDNWVLMTDLSSPPQLVVQPTGAGESRVLERGSIEAYQNAWWFPSGDSILILGSEHGRAARHFVQNLAGGRPRALTVEGSTAAAIARDGSWVIAKGPDRRYSLYPLAGGASRPVSWLTPTDRLYPWHLDGRSVLVGVGLPRSLPSRVERVDLVTGRRTLFAEIGPRDRTGLLSCELTGIAGDYRSFTYEAWWMLSSMFIAEPEKHGSTSSLSSSRGSGPRWSVASENGRNSGSSGRRKNSGRREDAERARQLQGKLGCWRLARDAREYVREARALVAAANRDIEEGSLLDKSLKWAEEYANRIDPLASLKVGPDLDRQVIATDSGGAAAVVET